MVLRRRRKKRLNVALIRTSLVLSNSSRSSSAGATAAYFYSSSSAWQWPSCKQPRTLSFRQQTMNSAADSNSSSSLDSLGSTCRTSSEASAAGAIDAEADAVVRALRSNRLFFDPDASPAAASSSSILNKVEKANSCKQTPALFDGATATSIESRDPYGDFRASMEAMVRSHGGGGGNKLDWRWLEDMLSWYLRANVKSTHGLVVAAFVDLLISLTTTSPASSSPAN